MKKTSKQKLLESALKIFAENGFESASTREIVKDANVNISSITYYFGGKEGLYQGVLEYISSTIAKNVGKQAEIIKTFFSQSNPTQGQCLEMLENSLKMMINFLCGKDISPHILSIFIREQIKPTTGFEIIYENRIRPMHEMLTKLVAGASGLSSSSDEAKLATHAILGQIIIFKTHVEVILRRMGWHKLDDEKIQKITNVVLKQTHFIINSYRGEEK